MTGETATNRGDDPILARRATWARAGSLARRGGWLLYGVAIAAFVIGFIVGFTEPWTTIVIAALLIGSALLLPAIIIGYAVRAAERDDLGLPDGH